MGYKDGVHRWMTLTTSPATKPSPERVSAPEQEEVLEVFAILSEFHQAMARAHDGYQFAITRKTPGIDVDALQEGQKLRCVVTRHLPRVLRVLG
jgi:hypothetical protein